MTEPRIQYAQTSDGVSIAYWTLGDGTPLVHLFLVLNHIQLEWEIEECRHWYERLAQNRRLVRYDVRGTGLSERNVTEQSLDAWVRDLEAVVDRLGLEQFALLGLMTSGPIAIAYAARHPERVSHLLLWCAYARGSDWLAVPQIRALRASFDADYTFYTEAAAHTLLGWSAGEPARRFADLIRAGASSSEMRAAHFALNKLDVTPSLSLVKSPTLVLHRRQFVLGVDVATGLASRIPNARLVLLEGDSGAPYMGDTEAVLTAIDEFLGEGQQPTTVAAPSGTAVILFTDIAGSTALTERMGDVVFRDASRALDAGLRAAIRDAGGTAIDGKLLGDGVLATFPSAAQAIDAARRCHALSGASELPLHLGIHAGDVIREQDPDGRGNVYGGAVNIASRVCGLSAPGEILVSDVVRGMARSSAGVEFEDRGEQEMKGVGEPVHVYAVRKDSA
jgi:class 3 adenylate cyclase